jgi:hypothetical protein
MPPPRLLAHRFAIDEIWQAAAAASARKATVGKVGCLWFATQACLVDERRRLQR